MFILSASGIVDRPRPTILTGYGGFGSVMMPTYRSDARAWVQAGGVYAIACIRGGGEEGAEWHRAGMRDSKQKVFDDFNAAADHLLSEGWTTKEQLGIYGESNGGLLMGAALTQHPEKYAAVVCQAPLLDMVRYERFGMGPSWRNEYGSVVEPAGFAALLSYSPYHAVREGTAYPAVLFGVFDADTRVDPLHARKMCARLQAATVSARPVVLRAEPGVGHGARAASSSIDLMVDRLAFFADQLGMPAADPVR
jgi:prolyl oligopeptidase